MRRIKQLRLTKQKSGIDKNFFYLVILFVFMGLVAIADASAPQALNSFNDKFYFLKHQSMWALIGIIIMFVVSRINYSYWEKVATPFFFVSVILLILVLIPQLSFKALGARRWIDLGFTSFQPSEVIKFSLSVYLAKVAAKGKNPASYFLPLIIVTGLIMLQPDLGTTMIIVFIAFSQIFVSGINLYYFFSSIAIGVISTLILIFISPYRRDRLLTFFEATSDPLGKSYHIRQILLGLGSGGIFGVGLGQSQQKFLFLPEASTDSIFAIIGEELGFIGSISLVLLFLYFIIKIFNVASHAPDRFSQILCYGVGAWLGGQIFLNIGSMVALVPLTGIPLPFFSYGGTNLVMILAACGIILNVSKFATIKK